MKFKILQLILLIQFIEILGSAHGNPKSHSGKRLGSHKAGVTSSSESNSGSSSSESNSRGSSSKSESSESASSSEESNSQSRSAEQRRGKSFHHSTSTTGQHHRKSAFPSTGVKHHRRFRFHPTGELRYRESVFPSAGEQHHKFPIFPSSEEQHHRLNIRPRFQKHNSTSLEKHGRTWFKHNVFTAEEKKNQSALQEVKNVRMENWVKLGQPPVLGHPGISKADFPHHTVFHSRESYEHSNPNDARRRFGNLRNYARELSGRRYLTTANAIPEGTIVHKE